MGIFYASCLVDYTYEYEHLSMAQPLFSCVTIPETETFNSGCLDAAEGLCESAIVKPCDQLTIFYIQEVACTTIVVARFGARALLFREAYFHSPTVQCPAASLTSGHECIMWSCQQPQAILGPFAVYFCFVGPPWERLKITDQIVLLCRRAKRHHKR